MALDHFVPQVHLKKFNSPALNGRMYALRKSDMKSFQPPSKDVCRIEDWSTNSYLRKDRILEEFLRTIEPKYSRAIENLKAGNYSQEAIYVIAGFAAYVVACSPTAVLQMEAPTKATVEATARILDSKGKFPAPPPALGGKSFSEMLDKGILRVRVDEKYSHAMGISTVLDIARMYGNFSWEVIHNNFSDSPFFTSDYPVAIEHNAKERALNRIVPLSPTLAVRIVPNRMIADDKCDFSFSHLRIRALVPTHKRVADINTLIVRCAADLVFYREDLPWVRPFVSRNRHFKVEQRAATKPHSKGLLLYTDSAIVDQRKPRKEHPSTVVEHPSQRADRH